MATGETEDGRNRENITLRLSEEFLADLDERWPEEGYARRSEFIRESLRGSVYGVQLSKQAPPTSSRASGRSPPATQSTQRRFATSSGGRAMVDE